MKQRSYLLNTRPVLANAYHAMHYRKQAVVRKEFREAFFWLGKQNFTTFDCVDIEVYHHYEKGRIADVGAVMNCAKAGIDGLVDAEIIPDDNPTYVKSLKFFAPVKADFYGIEIVLLEH